MLAAGAHAFLGRGGAIVVALFHAKEDVLELVHAGVGEQQRRVVRGHERRAAHDAVAAGMKEVEKALANFVTGQWRSFYGMGLPSIVTWNQRCSLRWLLRVGRPV